MGSVEQQWITWLGSQKDARSCVRLFVPQYHFFSINQVIAFSGLFRLVPKAQRESLAMLADVLHEELGRNQPGRVHSVLLERFAKAAGVDCELLPLSANQVVKGVKAYVDELYDIFFNGPLPRALAGYKFLESSAVETYGPLTKALKHIGFANHEVEFFELHAQVEVEHAAAADEMLKRQNFSAIDNNKVIEQSGRMQKLWSEFWTDIARVSGMASHDSR